jgi:hypothetical protein
MDRCGRACTGVPAGAVKKEKRVLPTWYTMYSYGVLQTVADIMPPDVDHPHVLPREMAYPIMMFGPFWKIELIIYGSIPGIRV